LSDNFFSENQGLELLPRKKESAVSIVALLEEFLKKPEVFPFFYNNF
jgi:hypothetical protein